MSPHAAGIQGKILVECPNPAPTRVIGMSIDQDRRAHEDHMPKYLCLQRALPGGDPEGARPSPTEMQAMYAKFTEWREKFRDNLTDLGGRLGQGELVTAERVPDGPLVEVKELVGGYMIVSAASLAEAIEVARGCPGLVRPGSGVEVIEIRAP
ncbi:MAG TPA: YciI family protein [Kofleriaceae bacterium]|nr:YciI family protein [Kofleriaceae bacterium]